ncbi:MAG: helix-turn-helix transcriptional regulator [Lachnospiraceae bacterium]|nr:helix-turn-helix transcriptional regulator [Lachnospiraceae bacterium]
MSAQEYISMPMTGLETMLKQVFLQHPEVQKRILEPEELFEYIQWMARNHGSEAADAFSEDDYQYSRDTGIADLGRQLRSNPHDRTALNTLAGVYSVQSEDRYIVSEQDISVHRMLRYMPAHWHSNNYFEVYYTFSGTCPIYFQNEVVDLKPGTVMIIAPSVVHASPCYMDDQIFFYYVFRASTFEQVFWNQLPSQSLMASFFRQALYGNQQNAYIQFETSEDPEIQELLARLIDESRQEQPYRSQMMNSLLTTFFILLLRRYEGTARLPRTETFFWKQEFSAILSYIQTHYAEVTVSDLSSLFHYSDRQITRIIQRCTGMSYADLIRKLRMENAASALRKGVLPIEKIAADAGYSTVSSFYRTFTSYYHCTPAEYRNREQN